MPPDGEESNIESPIIKDESTNVVAEAAGDQQGEENGGEEEQGISVLTMLKSDPPPDPIENGWIMHRSRSFPGHVYYFNQFTSECRWDLPFAQSAESLVAQVETTLKTLNEQQQQESQENGEPSSDQHDKSKESNKEKSDRSKSKSILKSSSKTETKEGHTEDGAIKQPDASGTSSSSRRHEKRRKHSSSSSSKRQKGHDDKKSSHEVRVLHILKKHNKSRRPASWRSPNITISKEEAIAELEEYLTILKESAQDPKELRATFEELAKTESDCSSAKRGGDVGYFGRKKMQPAFEMTSFALKIGELSEIIETSSGVHIILRLG